MTKAEFLFNGETRGREENRRFTLAKTERHANTDGEHSTMP
jgi:hypothetical protein